MAKGYTTKTALENYILQNIDASFDSQITSWIEAIEAFIDIQTGRNFIADSEASERVFDGRGGLELTIDDTIEITKLEIGETNPVEISSDDYRLYPSNILPKNVIQLKNVFFTKGFQNITVTAKWGYSATVPSDIKLAATVLLSGITNFSNNAKGKVQSESMGRYSVSYKDEAGWQEYRRILTILKGYKKFNF